MSQDSHQIDNISFSLEDGYIEFSYTDLSNKNKLATAYLQLPDTPDSIHTIDDIHNEDWSDKQREIFTQLTEYYYDSFKDHECAAAAAELNVYINHVETVTDDYNSTFYVAFNAQAAYILEESPVRTYYNKAYLFQKPASIGYEFDEDELIQKASSQYNNDLKRRLSEKMRECSDAISHFDNEQHIGDAFGEVLHKFMIDEFNEILFYFDYDSSLSDIAQDFYQNYACDICNDFINKLID